MLHPVPGPGPGVRVFRVPFQHSGSGSGSGLRSNPETRIKNDVILSKNTSGFLKFLKQFFNWPKFLDIWWQNIVIWVSGISFQWLAVTSLHSFSGFVKKNSNFSSFGHVFVPLVIPGPVPGPDCSNRFRVRVECHDPDATLQPSVFCINSRTFSSFSEDEWEPLFKRPS